MVEINVFHYVVHLGLAFTADTSGDINGTNINISFKTPAATKQIHFLYRADAAASADFHIYEGGNMSIAADGADVAPINRNRLGTPTASVMEGAADGSYTANLVQVGGTVTVGTATTLRHTHFGSGRKAGGAGEAFWEFVLKAETIYAVILTDTSGGANLANLEVSWFEVPPA